MKTNSDFQTALPLTEVTFFILLSLSRGPRHGYLIMKEVHGLSQGRVSLSTGTLYGALKRMLETGLVQRIDSGVRASGRIRKEYRLTESGQRLLVAEIRRLETLVGAARVYPLPEMS